MFCRKVSVLEPKDTHEMLPPRVHTPSLHTSNRPFLPSVPFSPPCLYLQVLSRLHPECEYIFQLERDEYRCLQYIAEHANTSHDGGFSCYTVSRMTTLWGICFSEASGLTELHVWMQCTQRLKLRSNGLDEPHLSSCAWASVLGLQDSPTRLEL